MGNKFLQVKNFRSIELEEMNKFLIEVGDNIFSITPIQDPKRVNLLIYVVIYYSSNK
jgi:hypothetical protein